MASSHSDLVSVHPGPDGLFGVVTERQETRRSSSTVGKVIHSEYARDGSHYCILTTNDSLGPMWISKGGYVWLGSHNGNVWTTATVGNWSTPDKIEFTPHTEKYGQWHVTKLPDLDTTSDCKTPTITYIWGFGDNDVHVATYEGIMYHWNGNTWRQFQTGIESALNSIHGLVRDSVYCVGYGSTIIHFNGESWKKLEMPTNIRKLKDTFTGVRAMYVIHATGVQEDILVCSRSGKLFIGNSQQAFEEILTAAGAKFYGLGTLGLSGITRIIAPGGTSGIWEITLSKDHKAAKAVSIYYGLHLAFRFDHCYTSTKRLKQQQFVQHFTPFISFQCLNKLQVCMNTVRLRGNHG